MSNLQQVYPGYDQSSEWFGVNTTNPNGLQRLWEPPVARVDNDPQQQVEQQAAAAAAAVRRSGSSARGGGGEIPQLYFDETNTIAPQRDPILYWVVGIGALIGLEMFFNSKKE